MTPILFDIPPEEDPEPGAPQAIEHGCDYMLLPDGTLEYYYNFLIYRWHINGEDIMARAYLDDNQQLVSVFVMGERLRHDEALQPLLRYLQRRYRVIQSFHADDAKTKNDTGYVEQFRHREAPAPP